MTCRQRCSARGHSPIRTRKARFSRCRERRFRWRSARRRPGCTASTRHKAGSIATGPNKWSWEAPVKPGLYQPEGEEPGGTHGGRFFRVRHGAEQGRPRGRAERVSDRALSGHSAEGQSDLHSAKRLHRSDQGKRRHESLAEFPHQGVPDKAEKRVSEISRARRAAGVPTGSDRDASRAARVGCRRHLRDERLSHARSTTSSWTTRSTACTSGDVPRTFFWTRMGTE